jgi:hypothetical protein
MATLPLLSGFSLSSLSDALRDNATAGGTSLVLGFGAGAALDKLSLTKDQAGNPIMLGAEPMWFQSVVFGGAGLVLAAIAESMGHAEVAHGIIGAAAAVIGMQGYQAYKLSALAAAAGGGTKGLGLTSARQLGTTARQLPTSARREQMRQHDVPGGFADFSTPYENPANRLAAVR